MNRAIKWIILILVLSSVFHFATVIAIPNVIMRATINNLSGLAGGFNLIGFPPKTDPTNRAVVRPSPDILYTACIFDVSKQPVRVTAPTTIFYTSLALIADTSDNFFVVNDQVSGTLDVIVIAANAPAPRAPDGAKVVRAPTNQGIALLRYFVPSDAEFPAIDLIRRGATCAPFAN